MSSSRVTSYSINIPSVLNAKGISREEMAGKSFYSRNLKLSRVNFDKYAEACASPQPQREDYKGKAFIEAYKKYRNDKVICNLFGDIKNQGIKEIGLDDKTVLSAENLAACVGDMKRVRELLTTKDGKFKENTFNHLKKEKEEFCRASFKAESSAQEGIKNGGEYLTMTCDKNQTCSMLRCKGKICSVCLENLKQDQKHRCSASFPNDSEIKNSAALFVSSLSVSPLELRYLPEEGFDYKEFQNKNISKINTAMKQYACSNRKTWGAGALQKELLDLSTCPRTGSTQQATQ
jgi:hypothetical protein